MSRGMTVHREIALAEQDCPACLIVFAVPEELLDQRRKDGQAFCCPQGHSLTFTKSENALLRTEVEALKAKLIHERDQAKAAMAEAAKVGAELQRVRKRANNGVCMHCNRTFANLARHMSTRHGNAT